MPAVLVIKTPSSSSSPRSLLSHGFKYAPRTRVLRGPRPKLTQLLLTIATTAAAIAGTSAAAAYLDAKFHISKDVGTIGRLKAGEAAYVKAGTPNPCDSASRDPIGLKSLIG